jgi:alanine-glyoxylate transaminase/serine-glyoxylate transaminase/serine-pyruvate transaminase
MSVRGGREFLAVPGPTTIPDEVLQAMQRPAVEIYSKPADRTDRQFATRPRPIVRN